MSYLLELLVNQVLEVSIISAPLSPVEMQDFTLVELEAALAPHHQTLSPLVEPEAPAPAP